MGMEWDPEGDAVRRKENRARMIAAIGAVLAIGVFVVRHFAEQARREDNERAMIALSDMRANPPAPVLPDLPAQDLDSLARDVCKHLLACGGRGSAEVAAQLDECVRVQTQQATDDFSRQVIRGAYQQVMAECGAMDCAQFPSCFMTTLQAAAGQPTAPPKQISPEQRAKFVKLVCEVSRENAGKVPDLKAPNRSPKMAELDAMMGELDLAGVADLMKQALATCQ